MQSLSPSDENRILAISAPALLPLLYRRRETILQRMIGEYRNGTQDFRPSVAEYVTVMDLIRDIETKLKNYEKGE